MKISVVVPIYKTPKYFADIAQKMLADNYKNKEIVAVIDGEMTREIKEALEPLEGKIQIINPNEHLGKARALNKAVTDLSTDIILFFDNDILLPADPLFLTTLLNEMKTHDIVEMPKEVIAESFFSAMIGYEYLSFAMACLSFSSFANRSPGVIGSAFAVKKELFDKLGGFKQVVHEDGDFGARAFRLHARYSYSTELKVKTTMPNNFTDWQKQRKRWTLINVLWFKDNFLYLLLRVLKQPSLFPTLVVIVLPAIISFLLFVIFNYFHIGFIIPVVFMVSQPLQFLSGIFLWLTHYTMVTQGLISMLLGFIISTLTYFVFSRFVKFRFNLFEYILYYYIYSPILTIVNIVMFILLLGKKKIDLDWKT
jgi:cellulose synthase/poly-beta-1,6-N-acetylglucosamine synthase-like glycosyltransferase